MTDRGKTDFETNSGQWHRFQEACCRRGRDSLDAPSTQVPIRVNGPGSWGRLTLPDIPKLAMGHLIGRGPVWIIRVPLAAALASPPVQHRAFSKLYSEANAPALGDEMCRGWDVRLDGGAA
jgi:hypothetical protein